MPSKNYRKHCQNWAGSPDLLNFSCITCSTRPKGLSKELLHINKLFCNDTVNSHAKPFPSLHSSVYVMINKTMAWKYF